MINGSPNMTSTGNAEVVSKNKALNLGEIKAKKLKLASKPSHVWLAVCGRCNLACAHCLGIPERRSTRKKDLVDLDWRIFEKLEEDLFPYVETLVLGGNNRGEQLLAKEWDKYCDRLLEFPMKIEITTNGVLLTNDRIDKLVRHGVNFRVSIDGAREETLKMMRGVKLSALVKRVEKINQTRIKHQDNGTRIVFNFATCYSNVYELPELIELGHKIGVDEICVMHLMPQIETQRYQSLFYHMDTYNQIAQKAKELAREKKIRLDIPPPFDLGQMVYKEIDEQINPDKGLKESKHNYCILPWTSVSITNKGTVEPCCVGAMREMGDLHKHFFKEIWNGKKYQKLRKEMIRNKQTRGCRNCSYRFFEQSTENLDSVILSDIGPAASYPFGIYLRKWIKDSVQKIPMGAKAKDVLIDIYRKF
jgi:radical SAM protein with 4Fe4S-binding SPASM domain